MNTLSKKQQNRKLAKHTEKKRKNIHWWWHKKHRDARKTSPWDMFDYISQDFVFNLFYMMIHKQFIRYFVMDYHRIYDLIRAIQRINPPLSRYKLKEKINNLFAGIETEEEVLDMFKLFGYNAIVKDDKIVITNDIERDESYNPAYPEQGEEYILPSYILKNFLLFRSAVSDCIMGKFPNNLDYWLYACRYLLMDNEDFHDFGLNTDIFPYIRR